MNDPIVEGAACACLEVHYNPKHDEESGLSRDRWTCKLCGTEYVKITFFENAVEQVEMLSEENQLQATYIDALEQEMEDLDELLDDYREDSQ